MESDLKNQEQQSLQDRLSGLEAQVVELQTQVAFQEQTIADLNGALHANQQDLAALIRRWQSVEEQYQSLQAQLGPGNEKPPHY